MVENLNESIVDIYSEFTVKIQYVELVNNKHFKFFGVWNSYNKFNIG